MLVTGGGFAFQTQNKAFTRCFAHDASLPSSNALFREAAHCFTKCDPISNRHLWNECAQLTLIPARDFNVTDANRAMRARFNDAAIHRFFIGVYPATPASRTECTFMTSPLLPAGPAKARNCFVLIVTRRYASAQQL